MISRGRLSISSDALYARISGEDILRRYLGVEFIPSLIHSPLRNDEHKSFSLFYGTSGDVLFKDHASGMSGDALTLLSLVWGCSRGETISRIWNECDCSSLEPVSAHEQRITPTDIQYRIRKLEQHDVDYWMDYGISPQWLKKAGVVPVSHFVIVNTGCAIFKADKYAYVFYSKDGIKLYQPFSKMKWLSTQRKECVQLYPILPQNGDIVCVCSSLKDALCLWANTGIPSIAPQSEGTSLPFAVVEDLKKRFKNCYIMYDNDKAGIGYAREAAKETGFTNVILPLSTGCKDISDWYKSLKDKNDFRQIKTLFNGKPD